MLWDLAGQHVYRQIHAIFLENVAAALVLFDDYTSTLSQHGIRVLFDLSSFKIIVGLTKIFLRQLAFRNIFTGRDKVCNLSLHIP